MPIKEAVPVISTGSFFIRDSKYHLYARKRTDALKDIAEYVIDAQPGVAEIEDISVNGVGSDFEKGFGSTSGVQYGGIYEEANGGLSLKFTSDENPVEIDQFSNIELSVRKYATDPEVLAVGDIDNSNKKIEIDESDFFKLEEFSDPQDKSYSVQLHHQGIKDDLGVLKTYDPTLRYTIDYTLSVSLSEDQMFEANDANRLKNDIALLQLKHGEDDILSVNQFLKSGDVFFVELKNEIMPIASVNDLYDLPDEFKKGGFVFEADDDPDFLHVAIDVPAQGVSFFRKPSTIMNGPLAIKIPRKPVIIPFRITTSSGYMYSGQNVYMNNDILNPSNSNRFDDLSDEQMLYRQMISFYGGLPAGVRVWTNRERFEVASITNRGSISQDQLLPANTEVELSRNIGVDQFDRTYNGPTPVPQEIRSTYNLQEGASVMYLGNGIDYAETITIFMDTDIKKRYILSGDINFKSPPIMTDCWATDIDPDEVIESSFSVDQSKREVILNKNQNLISNPTFAWGTKAWEVSDPTLVHIVNDRSRAQTMLHDSALRISPGHSARTYVWINQVDPEYSFSLYGMGTSSIRVKAYCKSGQRPMTFPSTTGSDKEIFFNQIELGNQFKRVSAKFYSSHSAVDDGVETATLPGSGDSSIPGDCNIFIIEIENSGSSDVIIDCVKLEPGYVVTRFSHSYDPYIIEYESEVENDLASEFVPEVALDPVNNSQNTGFLYIDIERNDIIEGGSPSDIGVIPSIRRKFSNRPYAKMRGKNKIQMVMDSSEPRRPFAGEMFVLSDSREIADISMISSPVSFSMDSIATKTFSKNVLSALVRDEANRVVPNALIRANLGDSPLVHDGQFFKSSIDETTNQRGIVKFVVEGILEESVSPFIEMDILMSGESFDPDKKYLAVQLSSGGLDAETKQAININGPDAKMFLWKVVGRTIIVSCPMDYTISGNSISLTESTYSWIDEVENIIIGMNMLPTRSTNPSDYDFCAISTDGLFTDVFKSDFRYDFLVENNANPSVSFISNIDHRENHLYSHSSVEHQINKAELSPTLIDEQPGGWDLVDRFNITVNQKLRQGLKSGDKVSFTSPDGLLTYSNIISFVSSPSANVMGIALRDEINLDVDNTWSIVAAKHKPGYTAYSFQSDSWINPISWTMTVTNQDESMEFGESKTIENSGRFFFIDYQENVIYVSVQNLGPIKVYGKQSLVRINPMSKRRPELAYFLIPAIHRSLAYLMFYEDSALSANEKLISSWPKFWLKFSGDVTQYALIQVGEISDKATIIYRNRSAR